MSLSNGDYYAVIGSLNKFTQTMFTSNLYENNVYPFTPKFYNIKMVCKGSTWTWYPDVMRNIAIQYGKSIGIVLNIRLHIGCLQLKYTPNFKLDCVAGQGPWLVLTDKRFLHIWWKTTS